MALAILTPIDDLELLFADSGIFWETAEHESAKTETTEDQQTSAQKAAQANILKIGTLGVIVGFFIGVVVKR